MKIPAKVVRGVVSRLVRRVVVGVGGFTGAGDCEIIVWTGEIIVWQNEIICWGNAA